MMGYTEQDRFAFAVNEKLLLDRMAAEAIQPTMTRKAYLLQGVSFLALVAAWGVR